MRCYPITNCLGTNSNIPLVCCQAGLDSLKLLISHNENDRLYENVSISRHLYTLTRRPHVAGSEANAEAASYVLSTLSACNMKAHVEIYEGDPYADVARQVLPTFHSYAKSGSVTGRVVYVNYGRVEDYETLKEMGVNVTGTVVLARYGKINRGDIVMNAFDAGAVGALVGTVYNGSGDPTTPGWASTKTLEAAKKRLETETNNHFLQLRCRGVWFGASVCLSLVGSTEWAEENRELLASRAVAYINVDCAVTGAGFHASATPQLDDLLKQAARQIGRLGGTGSDYAAFLQHIGCSGSGLAVQIR
ncbi:Peptidase M28 family protein isoform 2 [Hibiscus syriacus]|uniref:Peptidase M28 family protein isoform 2 n=1 Tax=Hibiscus syriacus TaxID=106335 RepID=A0A6A3APV6_HIBSY|nr:Peptidase M28 family protein isoform 2 [Hibiscus syriacus]